MPSMFNRTPSPSHPCVHISPHLGDALRVHRKTLTLTLKDALCVHRIALILSFFIFLNSLIALTFLYPLVVSSTFLISSISLIFFVLSLSFKFLDFLNSLIFLNSDVMRVWWYKFNVRVKFLDFLDFLYPLVVSSIFLISLIFFIV